VRKFTPPSPRTSTCPGSGAKVTSTSPSLLKEKPFAPIAIESSPAVPMTRSSSPGSPSAIAISISGKLFSDAAPGPKNPPDWSSVRLSTVPATPEMEMESVFAVVAAPHAIGVAPKWSPPSTTTSVASSPASIVAVTVFAPASYAQDSAAAVAGKAAKAKRIVPARTISRMCA
jgi:hypothetical protein